MSARARVLDQFPYPIALPYSLIFDESLSIAERRWALCFTQYQTLRVLCLPLISQYLLEPNLLATKQQEQAIHKLNTCVASLKSPFFSDWVTAVHTLPKHLPTVGVTSLFPQLTGALKALDTPAERLLGTRKTNLLKPVDAIVALRNATAHGGLSDETEAAEHLAIYLPVLHQVLEAFDFLAEYRWLCCDDPNAEPTTVVTLRGTQPTTEELPDLPSALWSAFRDSPAVVVAPDGRAVPLFPLMNPCPPGERLFLYDGHYGIRVDGKSAAEDSYLYYLGTYRRVQDRDSVGRLQELLAQRNIYFFTEKIDTAPWTIADHILDYTHAALDELKESGKYLPECYVPYAEAHTHLDAFLNRSSATGFVLGGMAGHGKTALLAHLAERCLHQDEHDARRENPNLVLFLRGNGLYSYPELMLFRNVLEKAGGLFGGKGFGQWRDFLAHLHAKRKDDRVEGRRLLLIVDAVNEGPFPDRVTQEALAMIREASRYDWVKVIVSTRWEWLGEYSRKQEGGGATPLEETRPYLYVAELPRPGEPPRPPVIHLDPPTAEQAEPLYTRYQTLTARRPPCPTPWAELTPETREVLRNPLHVRLLMEVFSGTPSVPVTTKPRLYQRYVDGIQPGKTSFWETVAAVLAPLLALESRTTADLTDDDVTAIRDAFFASAPTPADRLYREKTQFHPVEILAAEGLLVKRMRIDGGGYKFVYQEVAEYLLYRELRGQRPTGEDEFAYWLRLAQRETVFPEYAGALLFLLRAWEERDEARAWIGRLVAEGAAWTGDALTKLLDELARVEFVPCRASVRGERLAEVLGQCSDPRVADSLHSAGFSLCQTRFAPTAVSYYRASTGVSTRLFNENPESNEIAAGLAGGFGNLGLLLSDTGRAAEAEDAHRCCVRVYEELHRRNPESMKIATGLARGLNNLGNLLRASHQLAHAEDALRRCAQVYEELHCRNSENVESADGLANGLNNLGLLLSDSGRVPEAEDVFRRCVQGYQELHRRDPENAGIATGLANGLNNLGLLLRDSGRGADAEDAHRRCLRIREELHHRNPENVTSADGLASGLGNLGVLLHASGRLADAEDAYCRCVQIREKLHYLNPDNVVVAAGLASGLNNLGVLQKESGRLSDAEDAFRRCVQVYKELHRRNPENVVIADGLSGGLNNLGSLLLAFGRVSDAEAAFRRCVQVSEELCRRNSGNVDIAAGLARGLNNLGVLLRDAGRESGAEAAYRRGLQVYQDLHHSSPENVVITDGLASGLNNLGNLLRDAGRVSDAEDAYRRSVQLREELYRRNPGNIDVKLGLTTALCNVGRRAEARQLVNEVLAVVPNHARANYLDQWLQAKGQ